MKGVKFGGLHSYNEWGLILTEKELKSPDIKTYTVELEGSNGVLDFTDFFGAVKYENRQLTFRFIKPNITPDGFLSLYSLVQNTLHGKKMQVILDDDPAYFYYGRVSINDWKSNKGIGEIVIEVDAEPYKYKLEKSKQVVKFYGKNILNLENMMQGGFNSIVGQTFENLTANTSTIRLRSISPFYAKANTKYTLTFPNATFKGSIREFDKSNVLVAGSGWVTSPYTFTTTKTTEKLAVYIAFSDDRTITTNDVLGKEIQLQEGTSTTFEAYDHTEKTVTTFLNNLKMPTVPAIYSQDDITITNGEETLVIYAGETLTADEFELKEGSNQFNITGTGVVVFDWQEGSL